jgi:hypothetical protein
MVTARLVAAVALVGLVGLVACQSDQATMFPPGLEPLEANSVPTSLRGARTETLATKTGTAGYLWVHGRGYVFTDPGTLWAIAKHPEVMYARCSTDARSVVANDEPSYEYSFAVHYTVNQVVTVEWDDDWRFGTITGTPAAPTLTMVRHQKVQGSSFITLSEGTIQLLATDDPQVTEVAFVEHLDAVSGSAGDVVRGMQDNFNRLVAAAHAQATPACP